MERCIRGALAACRRVDLSDGEKAGGLASRCPDGSRELSGASLQSGMRTFVLIPGAGGSAWVWSRVTPFLGNAVDRAGVSNPDLHAPYRVLAGENISARFVVPTVASSVDLVVHLGIGHDGVRRVEEIVGVPGRVENDVIEAEPLFLSERHHLVRTQGMPPHAERYDRVGIDVRALLNGGG